MSAPDRHWRTFLAFDTDDVEFARGVEVGLIFAQLTSDPTPRQATMLSSNVEMALRLGAATGRTVREIDTTGADEWMVVEFGPAT